MWQSAYAELVFDDTLWPDFDRTNLWRACEHFAARDRRYGGAVPNEVAFEQERQYDESEYEEPLDDISL
jgi:undecaprenyl diphosphate synthase